MLGCWGVERSRSLSTHSLSAPPRYRKGLNTTEVIYKAGLRRDSSDSDWLSALSTYGKTEEMLLEEICHVGESGTGSAGPWPHRGFDPAPPIPPRAHLDL